MRNLLSPKNDYVFKRVFGYSGNEEVTKDLLSSIMKVDISSIEIGQEVVLEKDMKKDKVGVLDVKAIINKDIVCNIEMQVVDRKDIEKRILFYWSKLYISRIRDGEKYEKLGKTIVILITDYEIKNLKELKQYSTKWNLKEEKNTKKVLTDILEIYIIELQKYRKYAGNKDKKELDEWIEFINNPEKINKKRCKKEVEEAMKTLERISRSEREERLAELRQKYIMDQKAIEDAGIDKGMEKGIEKGIEIGKKKGIQERNKSVAKKLKKIGMDKKMISEITDLSIEEIEKL